MKKLFLFLSLAILSIGVQAQKIADMKTAPFGTVKYSTQSVLNNKNFFNNQSNFNIQNRFSSISAAAKNKAPKLKAELAENERLIGVYTTDDWNNTGGALTQNGNTYMAFAIVPAENTKRLIGGNLHAIRFALADLVTIKNVFVMGVTKDDMVAKISETSTAGMSFSTGWNKVELTEPVTLSKEYNRYAIGYEYVETAGKYPLSLIKENSDEGFCLRGDLGEGENIYNLSNNGMLCVQGFVTMDNIPNLDVILDNMMLQSNTVAAGTQLQFAFQTSNFGREEVKSFEIDVKLDGKLEGTLTEKHFQITAEPKYFMGTIDLPADIARGNHTLSLELVKVNGAAPTEGLSDDKVSVNFTTYYASDAVARQKFLVEEMTSHSCTYCPYGAQLIEAILEQSDKVAVACIHGNQSSKDPFNTIECNVLLGYLGCQAFPSATFNRIYFSDDEGIAPGLGFSSGYDNLAKQFISIMEQYSLPSFASVNIEKSLSEDGKTLTIKVSGEGAAEASKLLKDFGLTVYVVEDGIKYRQLNLGTWVSNYIHNHVLRKVATAVNGDDINWVSSSAYENTFEVALDDSWVRENMSIVAFISKRQPLSGADLQSMEVSNANSIKLTASTEVDPGNTPGEDDTRVDAGLRITPFTTSTQLMGEGMSLNAKYVSGLNYATSAPCIWNTEANTFTNFTNYEEGSLHTVNSDGVAVGSSLGYGGKALIAYADGTSETLSDNGGANTQGADAWCISEDGKTIGGFYYYFEWTNAEQTEGFYATFPCVWQDKKCTTLSYPKKSEMGYNVDGAAVRWMSADASVLLGYIVDDKATWPAVIWRKNASGGYDCDPICKNYFEDGYKKGKPYMMFSPAALSANGEWIALTIQEEFDDSNFNNPIPAPKVARYNLKTGKLEILEGQAIALTASAISNDGSVLMYTNVDGIFGRVGYEWKSGETSVVCIDDQISKVKGVPAFGANVPAAYALDGKTIMGFGIDEDANIFSYVVSLEAIEEAINGIDKLTVAEPQNFKTGIYTITGRKVLNMNQPGLYIKDGKKVLVK